MKYAVATVIAAYATLALSGCDALTEALTPGLGQKLCTDPNSHGECFECHRASNEEDDSKSLKALIEELD